VEKVSALLCVSAVKIHPNFSPRKIKTLPKNIDFQPLLIYISAHSKPSVFWKSDLSQNCAGGALSTILRVFSLLFPREPDSYFGR
jgi:hypothetical protein